MDRPRIQWTSSDARSQIQLPARDILDRRASMKRWGVRVRDGARRLRTDALALWIAARDPRTPSAAKLLAAFVAAYAFSPIDLIPDFIPVLGLVDDLVIVPIGIALAVRLIPPDLMREFRDAAAGTARPRSVTAAIAVVAVWIGAVALVGWVAIARFVS